MRLYLSEFPTKSAFLSRKSSGFHWSEGCYYEKSEGHNLDFSTKQEFSNALLEEIRDNDFNLNINRYVDTTEPVEVMSVDNALTQLRVAERRREEAVAKMDALLAEMGYAR